MVQAYSGLCMSSGGLGAEWSKYCSDSVKTVDVPPRTLGFWLALSSQSMESIIDFFKMTETFWEAL